MKIVIFGNGFLGKSIYKTLYNYGHHVLIYSKKNGDYTDSYFLQDWLAKNQIDLVINASGYTGVPNVDAAEDDKALCWKLNVEVPAIIATSCKAVFSNMIHISSGCIYNGYDKIYTEDDVPNFGLFNPNSSFYSKTKHAAETILNNLPVYSFRLRIPFDGTLSPRNYLTKLMGYDNLISVENSVTCIDDFCNFVHKFISMMQTKEIDTGVYNVVNPGALTAKNVIDNLSIYGIKNPNHKFIDLHELNTKAKRSNVILSSEKINKLNLGLPPVNESLQKCIKEFASNWFLK